MARTIHINSNNASVVGGGPVLTTDATTERYKQSGGVWSSVSAGVVRAGDNQFGGVSGIRTEQTADNHLNSTFDGAVVGVIGSGGVLPTDWSFHTSPTTVEILELGTENGLPYIDQRWQYDNSASVSEKMMRLRWHGYADGFPCAPGQKTTLQWGIYQLSDASSAAPDHRMFWFWFDSVPTFLANSLQYFGAIPTVSNYPYANVASNSNANITQGHTEFIITIPAGETLDISFRLLASNCMPFDHTDESFISADTRAQTTRAADDLYLSGQSLPTELVSVIRFVTPLDLADYHSNTLLSVGGTDVLTIDASGNLDLTDGINTATITSPTITADTVYDLVIIAKPADGMVCGIIDTGTDTATWSTTTAYDGAFPVGDIELLNGFPVASIPLYVLEDGLPEADVATTKTWVEAESAAGWPGGLADGRFGIGLGIGL